MLDLLELITTGEAVESDLGLLEELSQYVRDNSICGLGKTAPNPTLSTLRHFRDEYLAHVIDHQCPAGVCKAMTTFVIDGEACTACGRCRRACPVEAIRGEKKVPHVIDQQKCIKCGLCRENCPTDGIMTVRRD